MPRRRGGAGLLEALRHVNVIMGQDGIRQKILEDERVETLLPILSRALLRALRALIDTVDAEAVDMACAALMTYGKCAMHVHIFSIAGGEAVTACTSIFREVKKCLGAISTEEDMFTFAPIVQCTMALAADAVRLGLFEDDAAIEGLARECAAALRSNFERFEASVPGPLTLHVEKLERLLEPSPAAA